MTMGSFTGDFTENSRGFTLLEILIAIFILGTVLSTIFASYTGTFRVIQETEARTDMYAMARVALSRMQEDLESAYIHPQQTSDEDLSDVQEAQFVGEDKTIDGNDADRLQFLSTAQILLGEEDNHSGLAEIRYYVKESEETEGLVLYRSDTPELQEKPEPDTGGAILCEGLSSVRFTYKDREGTEYDSWDSSWREDDAPLPAMVSILLEFHNRSQPDVPLRFMGGAAIPMAGERRHGQ
jgi:prepilin-type N-terminal cleavage/methylation domain-containing protein